MALILPGLFGSAIAAGNIHAFSLATAAVINGIIYFSIAWCVARWWQARSRNQKSSLLQ